MRDPLKWLVGMAILVGAFSSQADDTSAFDLVDIPGGTFQMGDPSGQPDEAPAPATVSPFRLMRFEVTNRQFRDFVAASGHRTDPEVTGTAYVWDREWTLTPGADWRHPFGPATTIDGLSDHPVVQISRQDAEAFCHYYGMRLPSEAEWEFAARGSDDRRFPWGNTPPQDMAARPANFGTVRCCAPDGADGYHYTAPVGQFPAGISPFGAHDMAGNVWEWTASPFPGREGRVALRGGGWGNNPYCLRAAYRHANPPNIGLNMVGFRCAAAAE